VSTTHPRAFPGRWPAFLLRGYAAAALCEGLANSVGDGKLFASPHWPVFFVLWYGWWMTVLFWLWRCVGRRGAVLLFAVLGVLLERGVFGRSNLVVDPIVYAFMAWLPCWTMDRKGTPPTAEGVGSPGQKQDE
jgi:hypothetical protein